MLRRRFAKLPVDEAGCKKALDFVLEGLIDYVGNNQDIKTDANEVQRNPMVRVFSIIQEELKFVSEFLHMKVPNYQNIELSGLDDLISIIFIVPNGFYLIWSLAKQNIAGQKAYNHCINIRNSKFVSVFGDLPGLDQTIAASLLLSCMHLPWTTMLGPRSKRWYNLILVKKYIKDPPSWNTYYSSMAACKLRKLFALLPYNINVLLKQKRENIKDDGVNSSIFDVSICARLPKFIRKKIPKSSPTVVYNPDAKEAILRSLRNSGGRLTNGETALKKYGMEHLILGFCQPNGSATEAILVWHIATTLLHHQEPSTQQNNDPHQEPYQMRWQEVALGLSSYCHYLVKSLPELLPDEVEWTEEMYGSVTKEILDIDQKPTKKDRCNYVLQARWVECSVIRKGVQLAKDLINSAENRKQVWKMLAEFWADMMLFISPSDNVEGHEKIIERGELITQLWALLTHAGIVTRPKPTNHPYHPSDKRDGEQMRMMLGEFWADMMVLIAPSNNIEGHEENLETGDALIKKLRVLLSHAGIVTRPEPINHQYPPSESRDGTQMRTMLGEFWADMILLIAPSNNMEAHEENLERGDMLITKLRALLSHAGIVTRSELSEHEVHQSQRIPVSGDELV